MKEVGTGTGGDGLSVKFQCFRIVTSFLNKEVKNLKLKPKLFRDCKHATGPFGIHIQLIARIQSLTTIVKIANFRKSQIEIYFCQRAWRHGIETT